MNPTISPADTYSTMSTPQTNWSPLLKAEDDATMAPSEMALSPDNSQWDASSPMAERSGDGSQKKKRKSWGQELPVPKTNLPPRKRAKTEDEKEQRRVERVLRNRRAAQTSRERKSREKETLEEELRQTKQTLEEVQSENAKLLAEIIKFRAGMTVFDMDIPIKSEQNTEPSLSVGIQKALQASTCPAVVEPGCTFVDQETYTLPITTPADADDDISKVVAESSSTATSSDLTQQPAELLCFDLQCQSGDIRPPWKMSNSVTVHSAHPMTAMITIITYLSMMMHSATYSTLQLTYPLATILHSLKMGSPLTLPSTAEASTSMIRLILFLISPMTTPSTASTTSSTCTTFTMSVRMALLKRLVSCSPNLARPLAATIFGRLRQLSDERTLQTGLDGCELDGMDREQSALLAILWQMEVYQKERRRRDTARASKISRPLGSTRIGKNRAVWRRAEKVK